MKTLLTCVFAVGFTLLSFSTYAQNITPNSAHVVINAQTDRGQLWNIYESLKTQGLTFNYEPTFDNNRRLINLTFSISDSAGNSVVSKTTSSGNFQTGTTMEINLEKEGNHWVKK
jgi:hypothetical protein